MNFCRSFDHVLELLFEAPCPPPPAYEPECLNCFNYLLIHVMRKTALERLELKILVIVITLSGQPDNWFLTVARQPQTSRNLVDFLFQLASLSSDQNEISLFFKEDISEFQCLAASKIIWLVTSKLTLTNRLVS